ncbi:MAG: hypothetical protein K0R08_824, partial [Solimicrobium sp.]|nr:hypothetical protein [Solimicrobium sp.]
MESIWNTRPPQRSNQPFRTPNRDADNLEQQFNSLLQARDLLEFAQKIQDASKMKRQQSAYYPSDKMFSDIADHLKNVISKSPKNQLNEKNWGINLGRIMYSLKQFFGQCQGLEEVLFCIAGLLADQSKPWIVSAQSIGNALYGLQKLKH